MDSQSLTELEGRTYRAVLDDGIGDLLLGLWLLAIGIGAATHRGWVAAVVSVNALMIWRLLRKIVTEPRVGYVRLRPRGWPSSGARRSSSPPSRRCC